MNGQTLFARALPSEIKVEEKYHYEVVVRSVPQVRQARGEEGELLPAEGTMMVLIPYDGMLYFTGQALGDVSRQVATLASLPDTHLAARVGHVALTNYERTDLGNNPALVEDNTVAVETPVLGDNLNGLSALRAGRDAGQAIFNYRPQMPGMIPLQVEARITDEDTLTSYQQQYLDGGEKVRAQALDILAHEMGRQASFTPGLRFFFELRLELPAPFGAVDDPEPPLLKRLALNWPVSTSYRPLHLNLTDKVRGWRPHPLRFDPARGTLEWGGIRFLPPEQRNEGNGLFTYRLPQIALRLDEPGDLYATPTLQGEIEIELPRLLSGLGVHFFNAQGVAQAIPLKLRSRLYADLTLDVVDCFRHRRFSPYQYLQFPNVALNNMNLGEISSLLKSMHFTLVGDEPVQLYDTAAQHDLIGDSRYLFIAYRPEGAGRLWLWLRVEGQEGRADREREGSNRKRYQTPVGSGDMVIALRAELEGDSQRPVQVLNELHRRLKERFLFGRTVK